MKIQIDPSIGCSECGFIGSLCICELKKKHKPDCRFLKAASLSIELACEHGYQACPICDPCDCGAGQEEGVK